MTTRKPNKGYHDEEDDIGAFWLIVGCIVLALIWTGFWLGHWVFPKH